MIRFAKLALQRLKLALLAVVVCAAPAFAAPVVSASVVSASVGGPDLIHWVGANTDLAAAQVAMVTPQLVYSLEPLGPKQPTGEVVALARAETTAPDWVASHGFASWDAHLLIDCANSRARVIRTATYSQPNRKGEATVKDADAQWMSAEPGKPVDQLIAAACDPAFSWPLRKSASAAEAAPKSGAVVEIVAGRPTPAAEQADATPQPVASPFAVQIARGPSLSGAQRAVTKARKALGPDSESLTSITETVQLGAARRYVATLNGFPSAETAAAACVTLAQAGQKCFVRTAALRPAGAEVPAIAKADAGPAGAAPASRIAASDRDDRHLARLHIAPGRAANACSRGQDSAAPCPPDRPASPMSHPEAVGDGRSGREILVGAGAVSG